MGSSSTDMVKKVSKGAAKKEEFPKNAVEKKGRVFSIGGDVLPPKRDLTRFVKWPKYVRLQRAKMTLLKRIKVPPGINQFSNTFDKRQASQLFRLLNNLKPETKTEKKARRNEAADAVAAGGKATSKKPVCVKQGLNHVTTLVEEKKAKLVVIAHDVDPIEIIVWLPALCKSMKIPYCIVKSKSRLGAVVNKKTATCLAITDAKPENKNDLENVITLARANFNECFDETMRKWGDAEASGRQAAHMAKLNAARAGK